MALSAKDREFLVNTFTENEQINPGIGANPATGGFQVVWQSDRQDGSFWGVFGQDFAAGGAARGDEISLADMTVGDQENPDVAFNDDGNGMWVWQTTAIYNSAASPIEGPSVARTFAAANYRTSSKTFGYEEEDGTTQEYYNAERLRDGGWDDDPIGKDAIEPTVIHIGDDMFINGWYRKDEDRIEYRYTVDQVSADFDKVVSANGDYARGFAEAETTGRTYTNFGDVELFRTVEDRRFGDLREMMVVTTLASSVDSADGVIQFQIFQETVSAGSAFLYGTRLPTDYNQRFVLDESGNTGDASRPRLAVLEDGGFAIVWHERDQSANNPDKWDMNVFVQVFNDDFTERTSLIEVDAGKGDQTLPEITPTKDGGFAISWTDGNGNGDDVMLQRFNEKGWKLGEEIRVNNTAGGDQGDADLESLKGGNIAITWESSNGDDDESGVMARVFELDSVANKTAQVIVGTSDNDKISTGGKADEVDGGAGKDTIKGGGGNDDLYGGGGKDKIQGGGGKDKIDGGDGDDQMTGGGGADTFFFGLGKDTITDFDDGTDVIVFDRDLSDTRLTKAVLEDLVEVVSGNLFFDFGKNELTIEGIRNFDKIRDDIEFA